MSRRVAGPLFAFNHAALGVDVVCVHESFGDLLAQDAEGSVDGLVVGAGQFQNIGGLVERGEGVGVGAKGQAQALQDAQQLILRDIGRAVEGHMLHEVGETALVVRFHQRAGVEPQPQ